MNIFLQYRMLLVKIGCLLRVKAVLGFFNTDIKINGFNFLIVGNLKLREIKK